MKQRVYLSLLHIFLVLLAACGSDSPPNLPGTALGGEPAAPFRLTDAAGPPLALADLRGQVVALTFLYTECPDICPVIARRLGQALAGLGRDAERVSVLVVSVDPTGDTPDTARAYLAKFDLAAPRHHYLLGNESELAPVWLAYGIASTPLTAAGSTPGAAPVGRLGHTDAVYLIDRDGRKQRLLRGDATVDDLTRGLRSLLR